MPDTLGRRLTDQPISTHDPLGTGTDHVVHNKEVIGDRIELVAIALRLRSRHPRPRTHLLIENAIAQGLHRVDLGIRGRDSHAEVAASKLTEPVVRVTGRRRRRADWSARGHRPAAARGGGLVSG